MDMKEIHFYPSKKDAPQFVLTDWVETERAIKNNNVIIRTTQMGLLDTILIWYHKYKVFIHDEYGDFEILIDEEMERTDQILNKKSDIFLMWKNGEFNL